MEAKPAGLDWARTWAFTTEPPAEYSSRMYERAVDRLNHFRKLSGLPAVRLNEKACGACRCHAEYVARNLGRPKVNFRTEDERLPGYTKEGAAVAKLCALRMGGGS